MPVTHFGPNPVSKELFNQQLVESPPPVIAIDTETISLRERMPIGFSIATSPDEAWYFRTYPNADPEVELVKPLLVNPKIKKVFHNAPFDLRSLPLVVPIDRTNIADTNVMARLIGRLETQLFMLSEEVGRVIAPAQSLLSEYNAKTMLDIPFEAVARKCCDDSEVTLALYHRYLPDIDQEYFKVEMEVIPILIDMSLRGIKIDQDDRAALEAKLEKDVAYYRGICESEGFNPASNQQVGYILAKRGNFLPFTKSRKSLQVSEEQLEFLDDPLAAVELAFRHANKFLTTYIRPLAGEERIYTEYSLDIVVGRIQSSNMNMQNIPGVKSPTGFNGRYIFVPDSGTFTDGDFSQEHLRILMHFSGDKEMEKVYNEGYSDGDIHLMTSRALGISRQTAKTINYAIPYGATPKTISFQAKIRDVRKCSRFLDSWFEAYRDAASWIKGAQEYALRTGKTLPTLFGREFKLPEDDSEDRIMKKGVNYPILGSDGEIMKRALIACSKANLPLAITVHDNIVCDGDIEFSPELEEIPGFRIPLEVKKTLRWE
jgi:DNA polymerase-1